MLICRSLLPQKMDRSISTSNSPGPTGKSGRRLYQKSVEITKKVVEDAKFKISEIDEVILVGGQTRMPKMQEEVKKLLAKNHTKALTPTK